MRAPLALVALLVLPSYGCGALLQLAVGWDNEETINKKETRSVTVTSAPPGATVVRTGGGSGELTLGTTPLTDSHALEFQQVTESPSTWAIWTGCVVEFAVGIGLAVADGAGSTTTSSDPFNDDFSASDSSSSTLQVVSGFMVLGAIGDLIIGIVQESSDDKVVKSEVLAGKAEYQYTARLAGLPDATQRVNVPEMSTAHLVLDPKYVAVGQTAPQNPAQTPVLAQLQPQAQTPADHSKPAVASSSWVIAVMNVEDSNKDSRDRALDPGLVRNLGDQIRVFIAQRGVRTIDRSSQDRALKEQIDAAKSDSYKSCYDDSCQIELGKALAASHVLRTRIARFGKRCVLNGELIDLKAEVTMAAASSQGDCGEEGFLNMGEEVAKNLVRVQ